MAAAPTVDMKGDTPALHSNHRGLLTVGVMLAMIMQILDTTIANVALPHMQTSLGATFDTVSWVLTSYIIAAAIAIPITGWLADRIGSRNLFIFAVAGFIISSMLCGIATSLEEMVIFRMMQGVSAAFIGPLSQTVMLDINPPSRQAKAMAVWGMGVMVGPIMGPVLGGWLTENYNWRWVFYVNLPLGIITLVLLWFLLPSRPRGSRNFDVFGFAMLALALGGFQLMLDRGQQENWFESWEICLEAGVALGALWMFLVHLFTGKNPIFSRELVSNRNLLTGMFFMIIVGITTMAPMALLPPMMQQLYGYPVVDTGLLLAPRGVAVLLTMAIAGQLISRIDPRWLITTGLFLSALALWQMAHWTLEMSWQSFVISGFIQGLGMGLVFMPLNAMAFASLKPGTQTDGASLLNLFRSLGSSIGVSIVTVLLTRNSQISHTDIASNLTAFSISAFDLSSLDRLGMVGDAALAMANAEVTKQAMMIAYLDDFFMMAIMSICVMPLIFIMKRPTGGPLAKVVLD